MALTFGMGGNVWPLISWKLSVAYQCLISTVYYYLLLLGAFHRYLSTVLCGLRQRLCLVDIEFRCHGQDTSVWTDSARGTAGLDSKKISSSSNSSISFTLHPGQWFDDSCFSKFNVSKNVYRPIGLRFGRSAIPLSLSLATFRFF